MKTCATPMTYSALFLPLCPTPLPRIKQKIRFNEKTGCPAAMGHKAHSDKFWPAACLHTTGHFYSTFSWYFFHAYSSSIYPDPCPSLSFISQRNNLTLVAFSLLVPGFLHLYPHIYFFYHFLSHLEFKFCYWYSYCDAAGPASFHSQKSSNYSLPIICEVTV